MEKHSNLKMFCNGIEIPLQGAELPTIDTDFPPHFVGQTGEFKLKTGWKVSFVITDVEKD